VSYIIRISIVRFYNVDLYQQIQYIYEEIFSMLPK